MRDDGNLSTPTRTTTSIFERVAAFVLETAPDDVPVEVLEHAACLLLDTIGVAAASSDMEAGRIARNAAVLHMASGHRAPSAPLLFDGRPVSLPGAVYAAATQIDNLDAHDGYNPVKGHIGVAAVPALIALAACLPRLSGRDALATLVLGYEIGARAGAALHATVSDYHTSGAWNALAVAAMATRLRGGNSDTLRHALGIAEYHGPRSQMMREIAHPTMLHDGSGWGAQAGMMAALLAEAGFQGAPAITVEGVEAVDHWATLGSEWLILNQYIKPYPVCRWAHAAVEGARELRSQHKLIADDIAGVRIGTFEKAICLFPGMPTTTSEAQYSLPFAVAQMLVAGELTVAQIDGPALGDPAVVRLVGATEMVAEDRFEARFPDERWAEVTLVLKDGRRLSSGEITGRGGKVRPFGRDDIIAKFRDYATLPLGESRASAIERAALTLASPDAAFSDLGRHLIAPPVTQRRTD